MSGDLGGAFGDLHLSAWIGETPDGSDALYLLLTTADERAPATMPIVAAHLGLTPGGVTLAVDPESCRVEVTADGWLYICWTGDRIGRPSHPEATEMIRAQGRAVLTIGHAPDTPDLDGIDYVRAHGNQVSLGVVNARVL